MEHFFDDQFAHLDDAIDVLPDVGMSAMCQVNSNERDVLLRAWKCFQEV